MDPKNHHSLWILLACVVLSACIGRLIRADEPGVPGNAQPPKIKKFTQDDITAFRKEYDRGVTMLNSFISGKPPVPRTREEASADYFSGRAFALRIMGETRAVEHAGDIARNLSYHSSGYVWDEGRYELFDFPAADALVQMGSNAYPAIYDRLNEPCSELDIAIIVHIVLKVDGRELGIARLKIKAREYGKGETFPIVKNLARVRAILENELLPPEKYSPVKLYQQGLKTPALFQVDDDE